MADPYQPPQNAGEQPPAPKHRTRVTVIEILIGVAVIGIVGAVAMPSYSDYTPRARIADVRAALAEGSEAVSAFHRQHGRLPASAAEAGWPSPTHRASRYAKELSYDAATRELRAVLHDTNRSQVDGKTLRLRASLDDGRLAWRCYSPDVAPHFLPSACRD